MKKSARVITALPALLLLGGCGIARDILHPPVDWAFIQSVGGLTVGRHYVDQGILWIPLDMDLSGNRTVTVKPVLQNSGLRCARVDSSRSSPVLEPGTFDIYLEVRAREETLPSHPSCDEVPVPLHVMLSPYLPPYVPRNKKYRLWYRDSIFEKHLLAEFVI